MYTYKKEDSWREHQAEFIYRKRKKRFFQSAARKTMALLVVCLVLVGTWQYFSVHQHMQPLYHNPPAGSSRVTQPVIEPLHLSRTRVREIMQDKPLLNAHKNIFFADTPEESFRIVTSLDPDLNAFLTSRLDHLKTLTRGKPRQIAMVVMDANLGQILAMAGFDLENPEINPCTAAIYPAASIFKIVTAAAAVDALGYTPQTPLYFNGNKYTLYKRQLKDVKNKYTIKVSLASAFADSINPVFGKLGQTYLGRKTLSAYAQAFGFNQTPLTDLVFDGGRFSMNEDDFHLAELGCGFNRDTLISPVFGAMMLTPLFNQGQILLPAVVTRVTNAKGETVYKHTKEHLASAIDPASAAAIIRLMEKTVSQGTARKAFGRFSRDKTLSSLVIGGKTGSLSNREHTIKYDWFTGFGKEKTGTRAIVVSIVVGHGKYIGTRAPTHARSILKHYFATKQASSSS
ncbi:MAG TPA: penicillin-binding transpeptidase domain-containing protein [Desulfotignum sp.]|nr:penicillin-binding transpeptidase domain-containing protein [Desulfotignum sp.]